MTQPNQTLNNICTTFDPMIQLQTNFESQLFLVNVYVSVSQLLPCLLQKYNS